MRRPTSVTVFGVLNLVWSLFSGCGSVMLIALLMAEGERPALGGPGAVPPGAMGIWLRVTSVVGLVLVGVLFVSGIGLLRMRTWGRTLAVGYSMVTIALTAFNTIVQWAFLMVPMMRAGGGMGPAEIGMIAGGSVAGTCMALAYPIALWYFMTRPHVVAAFEGVAAGTQDSWSAPAPSAMNVAAHSSNPYLSPQTDTSQPIVAEPVSESIVEALVPSQNGPALASYYIGLFSLFPLLGFPMGVAAVYLGIKGLRRVRENPAVRGGAHAWVGIVCGSLFGLFIFLLVLLTILAVIGAALGKFR